MSVALRIDHDWRQVMKKQRVFYIGWVFVFWVVAPVSSANAEIFSATALMAAARAVGVEIIASVLISLFSTIVAIWKGWQEKTTSNQLNSWFYYKYLLVAVLPVVLFNLAVFIFGELADLAIYVFQDAWGSPLVVEFTGLTGYVLQLLNFDLIMSMYISAYSFRLTLRFFRVV